MTNITNEQLEAWASLGPWEWGETGSRFQPETALVHKDAGIVLNASWRPSSCEVTVSDPDSEALIAAAPALAATLLAERKAREVEVGRLTKVLSALDEIIESNIVGNDGPNRFWVGGVALEGPHADMIFKILRKIQKVCRQALKGPTP